MWSLCQNPWQTYSVPGTVLGLGVQSAPALGMRAAGQQEMSGPLHLGWPEQSLQGSEWSLAKLRPQLGCSLALEAAPASAQVKRAPKDSCPLPAQNLPTPTVLALTGAPKRKSLRRIGCQFTNESDQHKQL